MSEPREYHLTVECTRSGQPSPYADSFYDYIVIDMSPKPLSEHIVKRFCMGFVRKAYLEKHMPSAFSGEVISFKQIAERTWEYKTREMFTG